MSDEAVVQPKLETEEPVPEPEVAPELEVVVPEVAVPEVAVPQVSMSDVAASVLVAQGSSSAEQALEVLTAAADQTASQDTPAVLTAVADVVVATQAERVEVSEVAVVEPSVPQDTCWQQQNRVGWRKYGRKTLAQGRGSPFEGQAAVAMYYKCSQPGCPAKEIVMIPGTLETLELVLRGLQDPGRTVVKATGAHSHEPLPGSSEQVSFKGTQKCRRKFKHMQWKTEAPMVASTGLNSHLPPQPEPDVATFRVGGAGLDNAQ